MSRWKIVTVAERFNNENGVPKLRLSCGHIKTDPELSYGNETAFKIRRLANIMTGTEKVRCYECTKETKNV
jgi:hypothetical protein